MFKYCIVLNLCLLFLMGCASLGINGNQGTIRPGDTVNVRVTCRLEDGKTVYSSHPDTIQDGIKSHVFSPPIKPGPQEVVAGKEHKYLHYGKLRKFEPQVLTCVAEQIIGMKVHETKQMTLTRNLPIDLTYEDRYLKLTRTRTGARVATVGVTPFREQTGKEPVPGLKTEMKGTLGTLLIKVVSVEKDKVSIELDFENGDRFNTPFGEGVLSKDGDMYTYKIDSQVGFLVRSPPILGRISKVEEDAFEIDYGHPFGFQTLSCDVEILEINPEKKDEKS